MSEELETILEAWGEALMRFNNVDDDRDLAAHIIEQLEKRGLSIVNTPKPPRVYAVAESVPDDVPYLTAGKRYAVLDSDNKNQVRITDDEGDVVFISWNDCAHLNGGNWTRVEEPS